MMRSVEGYFTAFEQDELRRLMDHAERVGDGVAHIAMCDEVEVIQLDFIRLKIPLGLQKVFDTMADAAARAVLQDGNGLLMRSLHQLVDLCDFGHFVPVRRYVAHLRVGFSIPEAHVIDGLCEEGRPFGECRSAVLAPILPRVVLLMNDKCSILNRIIRK